MGSALAGSYTVQPGDTAYSIAARFGIKVDELLRRNKLLSPALRVGQVLDVPDGPKPPAPTRTHTVLAGETLYSIAKKYGLSLEAIRSANALTDAPLRVGQVILIPNPSASNAASSPPPPPTSVAPRPTVTVKPSPPPLPNLGTPPNASTVSSPPPTPGTPTSNPTLPAAVVGANLKPPALAPVPPGPLPRGTVSLPAPDPSNPFRPAKDQAPTDTPIRTASSAPLPDLGAPPNVPPEPVAGPPTDPTGAPPMSAPTDPAQSGEATVGVDPEILHSVARGDTLTSIAKRYGVDVSAIRQANNLASDAIAIGQVLKIPVLQAQNPSVAANGPGVDLRNVSERYLGVTYRLGGASSEGLDCSGFVVIVFTELGIKVPRTSAQQFAVGQPVERADLRLGDLVFFNTSGQGVSHVGIYLESGEFIHAASNPGRVIKSRLDEKYYAQRYLGARRVMTDD